MTREEHYNYNALNYPASVLKWLNQSVDRVFDDFENKKCTNCKHCDQVKEGLIHCSYFEQYMPIEMGKCDMWEGKDE